MKQGIIASLLLALLIPAGIAPASAAGKRSSKGKVANTRSAKKSKTSPSKGSQRKSKTLAEKPTIHPFFGCLGLLSLPTINTIGLQDTTDVKEVRIINPLSGDEYPDPNGMEDISTYTFSRDGRLSSLSESWGDTAGYSKEEYFYSPDGELAYVDTEVMAAHQDCITYEYALKFRWTPVYTDGRITQIKEQFIGATGKKYNESTGVETPYSYTMPDAPVYTLDITYGPDGKMRSAVCPQDPKISFTNVGNEIEGSWYQWSVWGTRYPTWELVHYEALGDTGYIDEYNDIITGSKGTILQRDSHGNWTKKSTTGADGHTNYYYREISYY